MTSVVDAPRESGVLKAPPSVTVGCGRPLASNLELPASMKLDATVVLIQHSMEKLRCVLATDRTVSLRSTYLNRYLALGEVNASTNSELSQISNCFDLHHRQVRSGSPHR